jgi:hypothetical protein
LHCDCERTVDKERRFNSEPTLSSEGQCVASEIEDTRWGVPSIVVLRIKQVNSFAAGAAANVLVDFGAFHFSRNRLRECTDGLLWW